MIKVLSIKYNETIYGKIANHILLALCAFSFAYYMQFEFILFKAAIAYVVLYFAKEKTTPGPLSWTECLMLYLLSFLISVSFILGYHIHVENHYTGLIDTSYITEYHVWDLFALFFMMYGFFLVFRFLFSIHQKTNAEALVVAGNNNRKKTMLFKYMVIFFLCWLPYLMTYYPGFVFGDSLGSIQQALRNQPLDNAHPVLYTMLVRFCIWLGQITGDKLTTGCAIYCIIQILYMSYGMGTLFHWLETTFQIKKYLIYVMMACFAFSPYIGQYGIAMWKDPIFSTTVLLLTLEIAEILYFAPSLKKKKTKKEPPKRGNYLRLFFLLFLLVFSRNNGFYIVVALLCFAAVFSILAKKQPAYMTLAGIFLIVLLGSKFITGPMYRQLDVSQKNEKVESYGIFLQQMARVVAVNGKLSQEDKKYMDSLLPLDQYAAVYTPCCVDQLKWNENFQKETLEHGFFRTYFSILLKNPKICFESWMLQTYGYWSLNCRAVNELDANILYGVPRNVNPKYTDAVDLGIHFKTVNKDAWNVKTFPYQSRCVPLGMIHWLLVLLLFLSLRQKDWNSIMILGASLGLMATLLIASPLNYWPRYGLAEQLLLPLYLILLVRLLGNHTLGKWIQTSGSGKPRG